MDDRRRVSRWRDEAARAAEGERSTQIHTMKTLVNNRRARLMAAAEREPPGARD